MSTLCDKIRKKKSQSLLKIYILLHTAIKKKMSDFFMNDVQKSDDGDAIDDNIKNVRGRRGKKLS